MSDFHIHNSHDEYFRNPFGAAKTNSRIKLRFKLRSEKQLVAVSLILWRDGKNVKKIEMTAERKEGILHTYSIEIGVPDECDLMWYYFMIEDEEGIYFYGNNKKKLGGEGELYQINAIPYQITVYNEKLKAPNWFKEAVIYQIFPDRFYNGNEDGVVSNPKKNSFIYANWGDKPLYIKDENGRIARWEFFGGNLLGIIKKLDYLKDLGINTIYLNPIFEARSNHRYDTADYKKIDPMLGDNNTFKDLCKLAKEKGISIILDGVFNHTGCDSIYFNRENTYEELGAYQSVESKYYKWFNFKNHPDEYESWWGVDDLPNVNEDNEEYKNFIIHDNDSVVKKWIKLGAKGWRLDVVDELPEKFVKSIWSEMKELDNETVLIGEVWEDASNKMSYGKTRKYAMGGELDSVMNYPFRSAIIDFLIGKTDAQGFRSQLMTLKENYPTEFFYSAMNLIGSHDRARIMTLLGEAPNSKDMSIVEKTKFELADDKRRLAIGRMKLAVAMQMTLPGVPSIYYGDEVGMEGYEDPWNRGAFPWDSGNKELLEWYKKMIALRKEESVFTTGTWNIIYAEGDIVVYIREIKDNKDIFDTSQKKQLAIVAVNVNKEKDYEIDVDVSSYPIEKMTTGIGDEKEIVVDEGKLKLKIERVGVIIMFGG
ncbi:MAG: glycoside hydrolase family 13 protein [Alkaliphilus sp.]